VATASTSEIGQVLKRPIRIPDTAENLHAKFRAAGLYPHLILDGLFSDEAMEELLDDIASLHDDRWVHHEEKWLTESNLRSAVDLGDRWEIKLPRCAAGREERNGAKILAIYFQTVGRANGGDGIAA
jgi:hypothetical protein